MQRALFNVQYILCTLGVLPHSQDDTGWAPVHATCLLHFPNDGPCASADLVWGLEMNIEKRPPSEMIGVATEIGIGIGTADTYADSCYSFQHFHYSSYKETLGYYMLNSWM
jgi:hypothetical protein